MTEFSDVNDALHELQKELETFRSAVSQVNAARRIAEAATQAGVTISEESKKLAESVERLIDRSDKTLVQLENLGLEGHLSTLTSGCESVRDSLSDARRLSDEHTQAVQKALDGVTSQTKDELRQLHDAVGQDLRNVNAALQTTQARVETLERSLLDRIDSLKLLSISRRLYVHLILLLVSVVLSGIAVLGPMFTEGKEASVDSKAPAQARLEVSDASE